MDDPAAAVEAPPAEEVIPAAEGSKPVVVPAVSDEPAPLLGPVR